MITNEEILHAASLLKNGKVVAFPTETVYGLGADARNESAVKQIFAIKQRPLNNPLIVHLADQHQVTDWACEISANARALMAAFWPGPLTLLLKKQPDVSPLITAGQAQIGLRVPKHPVAQALLRAFGDGLAAPSANRFTRISPTTAEAVFEALHTDVDFILDGGACEVGVESTILDMSGSVPILLRPGMLQIETIEDVIQQKVSTHHSQKILAPGNHQLHYAPLTPTLLVEEEQACHASPCLTHAGVNSNWHSDLKQPLFCHASESWHPGFQEYQSIAFLTHKPVTNLPENIKPIPMPSDPHLYAQQLYEVLRKVDNQGFELIVIQRVPSSSAWHAINDRLLKATAVRSAL